MIVGHGVDIVDVDRVRDLLRRHPDRFRRRCFTDGELAYAEAGGALADTRLAGRFAAKEAASKALGTGIAAGIAWTDLEVLPNDRGAPQLNLSGAAAERAAAIGATRWLCSISHAAGVAIASVILEGPEKAIAGEPDPATGTPSR